MSQRKTSTAKELRAFLVHLLCILTLVQGPPLEAAEQKVRERTLWVGEAESAEAGESLPGKAAAIWQEVKEELAEGAEVLKAQWVQARAETPKPGLAGTLPPLTDLPPEQVIPPPPKPPGVNTDAKKTTQAVAPRSVTAAPQAATVAVVPSFNLLSISWQPSDTSPASVLAPIASAVDRVYGFDACDPVDKWKLYDPAAPGVSDLTSITPAKGFWLEASQALTLPEGGPVPASVSIPLCVGWNLIGFPKSSARPVVSALQSIEGKYIRLFSFEPTDVKDPWEVYDVAVPAWANDMRVLQPGRGYWIYITEATTLTFSNEDDLPSVEVLSPTDLGEVVKQTPVLGTVRSPALASWNLSQREVDSTTWTQIATGTTPVEAGTLGTFDPTLLENGLYEMRLQAFDIHGNGIEEFRQSRFRLRRWPRAGSHPGPGGRRRSVLVERLAGISIESGAFVRIVLFLRLSSSGQALRDAVKTDPMLSSKFDSLGLAQMSANSKEFFRLIEIAASLGDGFGWTPWVEYTASEIKDLEHFEIWPRKYVPEGNSSWEINRGTFDNSSPIQTLPGFCVRVLKEIQIASIKGLPKNSVGNLGEGWMELIAGSDAAAAFVKAGLSGFSLRPILRGKSREPFGDYFQIACENFLAHHADRDVTIVPYKAFDTGALCFRHLGSLSYRKGELDSALDFSRTAEGWDGEQPLWIVSRRVVECCEANSIKGLRFRPVLTIGTKLHQEYTDRFERLFERVGENPKNRLW